MNGDLWKQLYPTIIGALAAACQVKCWIAVMLDIVIVLENFNDNYKAIIKC